MKKLLTSLTDEGSIPRCVPGAGASTTLSLGFF